jgi:hypothetical protein
MSDIDKTPDYTKKERDYLWDCIVREHKNTMEFNKKIGKPTGILGRLAGSYEKGNSLDKRYIRSDMWIVLNLPIEDLPLHINDENVYSRGIAIWRLSLGR